MCKIFKKEDFEQSLQEHGIQITPIQKNQFEIYTRMLIEWNQKMNLTAITDVDAIYEKHFLDSILPSFDCKLEGNLCDVGAGAGFPSIPMKIMYPQLQVTIVEPLGKRVQFLQALCTALDIEVAVVNARAEDFAKEHREQFDIVTARAVANLPMLAELCIPLVKQDGLFIAMKGANALEEYAQAKKAITTLGCEWLNTFEKTLSDGSKRMNIVFKKERLCAKKYPRAFAQIKKHPL